MGTDASNLEKQSAAYSLTKEQANELKGMALLPEEFRMKLLEKYFFEHGPRETIELFSQFIGMANSVILNTREFIEVFLMCECKMSDRMAEQINLPTLQGALNGIAVALPPSKGMCSGCAFRLGTTANQSPVTSSDALYAADEGNHTFMCHEDLDEKTLEPTRVCAGYAKASIPRIQALKEAL